MFVPLFHNRRPRIHHRRSLKRRRPVVHIPFLQEGIRRLLDCLVAMAKRCGTTRSRLLVAVGIGEPARARTRSHVATDESPSAVWIIAHAVLVELKMNRTRWPFVTGDGYVWLMT